MELLVGVDRRFVDFSRDPHQCFLLSSFLQVPVDRVVAEVGLAADEPLRERRPRIVEHFGEGLVPVDALRLLGPEGVALSQGAAVEFLVGDHAFMSTTMRPTIFALMKSSKTFGRSANGIVRASSFSIGGGRARPGGPPPPPPSPGRGASGPMSSRS